ncbi:hypothetical protein [Nostoc sp.]|uniref:hypothetical protein n=1 Tax=Nostoc sp. TaxID=1180 RepID=UPI002FF4A961
MTLLIAFRQLYVTDITLNWGLGIGDWEDFNRDSDPKQILKKFFPSTHYPADNSGHLENLTSISLS